MKVMRYGHLPHALMLAELLPVLADPTPAKIQRVLPLPRRDGVMESQVKGVGTADAPGTNDQHVENDAGVQEEVAALSQVEPSQLEVQRVKRRWRSKHTEEAREGQEQDERSHVESTDACSNDTAVMIEHLHVDLTHRAHVNVHVIWGRYTD